MKKLLSLAVVVAALCASVGCDDKKTTGSPAPKGGSSPVGGSTASKST